MTEEEILQAAAAMGSAATSSGPAVAEQSMMSLVSSSGPVVFAVLVILVVLSVASWAIAIAKFLELRRAASESKEFSEIFWNSAQDFGALEQALSRLRSSPLCAMFLKGYDELAKAGNQSGRVNEALLDRVERVLERAALEQAVRLESGVTFLATVATAAPFIGLFGTVWGIMNAFHGLSFVKTSTLQAVAPGISEALVATAVGLAAAIPASIAYNFVVVSVKRFKDSMGRFIGEFKVIAREAMGQ
jgi:biopolymer transport protein TolQ